MYKGYIYDVETQLYWVSSRYYSPELCRWISPDSIEYLDPQSINGLNLYAYCNNNPIMYADPSGHFLISTLIIGAIIGAGLGAFAGMSFSTSLPTFEWMNAGGSLMFGVTGTTTLTITGAQILGAAGLICATYMFASNNRPGNNRVQNKQIEQATRSAGYNPKDPRVRDILNEIHQYIRKNKLNLGWRELLELIKEWLG